MTGYLGSARPGDGPRRPADRSRASASTRASTGASVNLAAQWLSGDGRPLAVGRHRRRGLVRLLHRTHLAAGGGVPGVRALRRGGHAGAIDEDITRWTGGARYYFADNLALHLEYSRRVTDLPGDDDPTEDLAAARLDFALLSRPRAASRQGSGAAASEPFPWGCRAPGSLLPWRRRGGRRRLTPWRPHAPADPRPPPRRLEPDRERHHRPSRTPFRPPTPPPRRSPAPAPSISFATASTTRTTRATRRSGRASCRRDASRRGWWGRGSPRSACATRRS